MIKVYVYNKIIQSSDGILNKDNFEEKVSLILNEVLANKELQEAFDQSILEKLSASLPEAPTNNINNKLNLKNIATRSALKEVLLEHQGYVAVIKHLKNVWAPKNEKEYSLEPFKKEKMKEILDNKGSGWLDNLVENRITKHLEENAAGYIVSEMSKADKIVENELKKNSKNKL